MSNVSRSAALNMTHAFVRASPTPANVSHALMTTIASQAPHALVAAGIDPKDPLSQREVRRGRAVKVKRPDIRYVYGVKRS